MKPEINIWELLMSVGAREISVADAHTRIERLFISNAASLALYQKLTKEEQAAILTPLFNFDFDEDVLLDDDGSPFYGIATNKPFNLTTLDGIFDYMHHVGVTEGREDLQRNLRIALGIK